MMHSPPLTIPRSLAMTLLHEAVKSVAAFRPAPGGFSGASNRRGPGPSIGHIAQTSVLATSLGENTAPTNQPSTCLPGLKDNAREPP